jgi:hypothetical protein
MYQNLLYAVKKRMMDEVEMAFQNHPVFNDKVLVRHKFPYQERIQYGALLRSSSASLMRMSPDNYLAELYSHVRLTKSDNFPGLAIEWVRENHPNVTEYMISEDVSNQLNPTVRMFQTSQPILKGPGNTAYADNIGQIDLMINGTPVLAEFVDGKTGTVMLSKPAPSQALVQVSYYFRRIAPPGIYVFYFDSDTQFTVGTIYIVDGELAIEKTTGTETDVTLKHDRIYHKEIEGKGIEGSESFYWLYKNSNVPIPLVPGKDYSLEYSTGKITFLEAVPKGYQLVANYKWIPNPFLSQPYEFNSNWESHTIIPGVVLAIGRRAKAGDRQAIIVSQNQELQAKIYGGHWTMSFEFAIIAKDPMQMAEMADQIINWLWAVRKNVLEFEGITLNSVEPTGETEEVHIDTTGDMYYETSISIEVQTEWQEFVPYDVVIKDVIPAFGFTPEMNEYSVTETSNGVTVTPLKVDTRKVVRYPILGYERVL